MRAPDELRTLAFDIGIQLNAAGSCLIRIGNTHVLCSVSLEEKVPGWMKGKGRGWLTAEYGMLPGATHTRTDREAAKGKQQGRTVEIQRLIGRSLRQAVDLQLLGERQITLDCDVVNADGGTRCAAITGGWVALVLALRKHGLESSLVRQVAAVSAGILEGETAFRQGNILDLEYAEDSAAEVDANLVAARPLGGRGLDIVEFQGTGEGRAFSREETHQVLDLALAGCERLMAAQLEILG
jgi:ribonuclease PH